MNRRLTLSYWKNDKLRLGKLLECPDIMTQGETLEELEENIRDADLSMAVDDVPDGSSTICTNITARAAASGRRAHQMCIERGCLLYDNYLLFTRTLGFKSMSIVFRLYLQCRRFPKKQSTCQSE